MDLAFSFIISTIGFAYFIYGKKTVEALYIVFGLLLMIYPYFTQNFNLSVFLGIVFLAAPFLVKRLF